MALTKGAVVSVPPPPLPPPPPPPPAAVARPAPTAASGPTPNKAEVAAAFDEFEGPGFVRVDGFAFADALHLTINFNADFLSGLDSVLGCGLPSFALDKVLLALVGGLSNDFDDQILHVASFIVEKVGLVKFFT